MNKMQIRSRSCTQIACVVAPKLAKTKRIMDIIKSMSSHGSKPVVYSSQSQNLRPSNSYLTDLSLPPDDYCVFSGEMRAGAIVPIHSHSDRESFYILSGEMNFYDGTSWHVLKQGDFVDVLSNTKHAWRNASQSSAFLLVVTTVRMGVFLQKASSQAETKPDSQTASTQKEHFLKLVEEYGYWLGSPEDNQAIGLSTNWNRNAEE